VFPYLEERQQKKKWQFVLLPMIERRMARHETAGKNENMKRAMSAERNVLSEKPGIRR